MSRLRARPEDRPLFSRGPKFAFVVGLLLSRAPWASGAGQEPDPPEGPIPSIAPTANRFYTVTPCRALDTRLTGQPLAAGVTRLVTLNGTCGVSPTAASVSTNIAVTNVTASGTLQIYPAGDPVPTASALNYQVGKTRANNVLAATGSGFQIAIVASQAPGTLDLIVDVNGYFDDPTHNQPPQVSAGSDLTVTIPAAATLSGSMSDDGLPSGSGLSASWSVVSGPGTVTFGNPSLPATTATFSATGPYVLRLSASDSQITTSDDVSVLVTATPTDLWRFADQTSFGATPALVSRIQSVGFGPYLDEQFALPASSYPNLPLQPSSVPATCDSTCQRDNYSMYPLQRRFFTNALYGADQLRQRVALALHRLIVVSGRDVTHPSRMTPYLQIFDRNAFGNYRQILQEVTLNPAMGDYLNMATSTRNNPNENYPREVLQLFSVGPNLLNPDGTERLDGLGNPIPTYDQSVVSGFTKVFTGWSFAPPPAAGVVDYITPMVLDPTRHDTSAKQVLGTVLPAGQTGAQDLAAALDNIFNHPNVGPFVGMHLIHALVSSNPSPAYVARVAAVFDNNGSGVRGDLKAVVKAILLDPEARQTPPPGPASGRLSEPPLFITRILRAFDAKAANGTGTSDGYLAPQSSPMGFDVFRPNSVFSYYPAEYLVPGSTTALGPEFGILTATTALRRANFVNTMVFSNIAVGTNSPFGTSIDLTPIQSLASNPAAMVGELDRRLMHTTMSPAMKSSLITAISAVAATNPQLRAQQAVYLVCTSSQFQVER